MTHNYACKRLSQVTTNSNWKLKLAIDDFFFQFRPVSAAPPSPLPPHCRQLAQLRVMIAILTLDFDAFESWHARSTFYGHFLQNSWLVQSKLAQPANFNLQNQMEEKMPSSLDYTLHYKYIPLRVRLPPPPSTKRRNQSQKKSCKVIILMALHLKRFRLA